MLRKRVSIFGVALVCVVSLLVGCGDEKQETVPDNTSSRETMWEDRSKQETVSEDTTKIVQVTETNGLTITANVGELSVDIPDMQGGAPSEMPGGGMPPEMPDGENANGGMSPEMPSGESANGGMPTEIPNGETPPAGKSGGSVFTANGETITFTITDSTQITQEFQQGSEDVSAESIVMNSVLEITIDSENRASKIVIKNLQAGSGFGGSNEVVNGTSANIISEEMTVEAQEYLSEGDDENALRVDGTDVTLNNITVKKTGGNSSNTENGDFYGQNAGLLVLNGSTADIVGGTFQTDAVNGNAVFSYGEGTTVNISDAYIRTVKNNSGGIQTTGGGTMNAANLDVQTEGNSSAAIRSDRGGGTVNVSKGKYVTNGTGSPAVYCTADISVEEATLIANASEGIVVEGKNAVSLKDCDVTGNMEHTYNGDSDENIHCIMIYQSMSGDASIGEADFRAEGGSITSKAGDLFYITNTDCNISLKDVALTMANDIFLRVEGNSSARGWGTEGANGGDVILAADSQKIEGKILVDSISSLKFSMSNGTEYVGSINPDGAGGVVDVVLDESSTWTLTGDSYISSFEGELSQVDENGYHLYVDGEEVK